MLLNPLNFHAPSTLTEAVKLYASLENVKLHAGGTFLLNTLKLLKRKSSKTPDHIISLRKINELKGLETGDNALIIKAMTSIADIFNSSLLKNNFSVLKTVCRNISTQPIRNMATLGGNLTCRYTWTEMPAVMIGLEAHMHFLESDGKEQIIPAEEFYKNGAKTNHILTHVEIKKDTQCSIAYRRVKKTQFVDIPLLSILIKTHFKENQFTNTIVSVNNCVHFAQRDSKLEEFLNGKTPSPKLAIEALDHLDQSIYDTRSSDYKKHMFRVSIKSMLKEFTEKDTNH